MCVCMCVCVCTGVRVLAGGCYIKQEQKAPQTDVGAAIWLSTVISVSLCVFLSIRVFVCVCVCVCVRRSGKNRTKTGSIKQNELLKNMSLSVLRQITKSVR